MFSRSHLLIEKELGYLQEAHLYGIAASLINDNLYEWSVRVCGPKETNWESGIFRVYLKFDEYFNERPPRICFHTIPYHPNIDMITGQPCIDYLDDWQLWNESYKIATLLLQIQNMLANPVLEDPINYEAANMIRTSPEAYNSIVAECVKYSRKIDSGEIEPLDRQYSLPDLQSLNKPITPEPTPTESKKMTKLSFDDYLAQWNGIGTTRPHQQSINNYRESLKENARMQRIHFGMTSEEREDENLQKQEEYDNVYYGTLKAEKNTLIGMKGNKPRDSAKMAKINQMRKIYLPKKPLPTPRSPGRPVGNSDPEREVEDLVAWTQNLNPADLDF